MARDYTGGAMTAQNNKRYNYGTANAARPRFRTIDHHMSPSERGQQSLTYSKKNVSRGQATQIGSRQKTHQQA